jgi:hypothetical protein
MVSFIPAYGFEFCANRVIQPLHKAMASSPLRNEMSIVQSFAANRCRFMTFRIHCLFPLAKRSI